MSALALLDTLAGLGVSATVSPSGNLRLEPASRVPAELLAEVKAYKPELLAALTRPVLPVLPAALLPLIRAAVGGHLGRYVPLAPGLIPPDLNDFVLSAAALYAVGFDPDEQEAQLWQAWQAWAS